jgi:hypothetical protein
MITPYFHHKKVRTDQDNYDLAWGPPCRVWKASQQSWYTRPDPVPETISVDIMRSLLPRLSEVLRG